jgi:hypothetical protein
MCETLEVKTSLFVVFRKVDSMTGALEANINIEYSCRNFKISFV